MSRLFLICGLPGSGKTTLAKELEQEHAALRLSPDEWIAALYGSDVQERDRPLFESARGLVEGLQRDLAGRLLALGVNVILENGFWGRSEREDYRRWAEGIGAQVELRFLDVSRDELWSRLTARNANLPPGTFHVTEAELDLWLNGFEPPTSAELVANLSDLD